MTKLTLAAVALLLAAAPALAEPLTVSSLAFGTGIENHAVTGVDTVFTAGDYRLYCWTMVNDAGPADTIFHTWTLDDQFVQKIPLVVRGKRYRTYTFKTLTAALAGTWQVEVTDAAGNVLAQDAVVVKKPAAQTE